MDTAATIANRSKRVERFLLREPVDRDTRVVYSAGAPPTPTASERITAQIRASYIRSIVVSKRGYRAFRSDEPSEPIRVLFVCAADDADASPFECRVICTNDEAGIGRPLYTVRYYARGSHVLTMTSAGKLESSTNAGPLCLLLGLPVSEAPLLVSEFEMHHTDLMRKVWRIVKGKLDDKLLEPNETLQERRDRLDLWRKISDVLDCVAADFRVGVIDETE